jgi:primosomal protein N' (replication factor Y)
MIARVTLEIALRKEFDYFIPPELAEQVDVGSRVQVPVGSRKVLGCVTGLAEESAHPALKPIAHRTTAGSGSESTTTCSSNTGC